MIKENIVYLGEEKFPLYKVGVAQARQVSRILAWLGRYAAPIINEFSDEEGNISFDNVFELIARISDVLDEEALLTAFDTVIGCDREKTNEYFDVVLLAEAIEVLVKNETYRSILNRFFGGRSSN